MKPQFFFFYSPLGSVLRSQSMDDCNALFLWKSNYLSLKLIFSYDKMWKTVHTCEQKVMLKGVEELIWIVIIKSYNNVVCSGMWLWFWMDCACVNDEKASENDTVVC